MCVGRVVCWQQVFCGPAKNVCLTHMVLINGWLQRPPGGLKLLVRIVDKHGNFNVYGIWVNWIILLAQWVEREEIISSTNIHSLAIYGPSHRLHAHAQWHKVFWDFVNMKWPVAVRLFWLMRTKWYVCCRRLLNWNYLCVVCSLFLISWVRCGGWLIGSYCGICRNWLQERNEP